MIPYQLKQYIKHFFSAKPASGHGIHSPFVYELATKVLPDKPLDSSAPIEELRKKLLKNSGEIRITDYGAGSRLNQSNSRKICDIARHSLQPAGRCRLIYRLARHQQQGSIIELGTSLGLTTAYLALTNQPVKSIEGCANVARIASENFRKLNCTNIELINATFDEALPFSTDVMSSCSVVYIDGNHTCEATLRYYNLFSDCLPEGALMIFDDIYWSEGMHRAWKEIVNSENPQITVDLFHLGLVYLKKDQARETFKIRL